MLALGALTSGHRLCTLVQRAQGVDCNTGGQRSATCAYHCSSGKGAACCWGESITLASWWLVAVMTPGGIALVVWGRRSPKSETGTAFGALARSLLLECVTVCQVWCRRLSLDYSIRRALPMTGTNTNVPLFQDGCSMCAVRSLACLQLAVAFFFCVLTALHGAGACRASRSPGRVAMDRLRLGCLLVPRAHHLEPQIHAVLVCCKARLRVCSSSVHLSVFCLQSAGFFLIMNPGPKR